MRLLLTRPAEGAAQTKERLEASRHVVFVSPVIEIVPTGAPCPEGVVDAVLASSGHAFALLDDSFGISPEARRLLPLYLVGERTAEQARERGFEGPHVVAQDAQALATTLAGQPTTPKRTIYLAGRERKPDLEEGLARLGMHVEVVEVYDTPAATMLRPDTADALRMNRIDGVLHFSRRSASLFINLARPADADIESMAHFCLSEDVAAPLRDAGCTRVEIAEAPNEAALLALVDQA